MVDSIANVFFDEIFLFVIIICFVKYQTEKQENPILYSRFRSIMLVLIGIVFFDSLVRIADEFTFLHAAWMVPGLSLIYELLQPLFWYFSILTMDYWDHESETHMKKIQFWCRLLFAGEEVVMLFCFLVIQKQMLMENGNWNGLNWTVVFRMIYSIQPLVLGVSALGGYRHAETKEKKSHTKMVLLYFFLPFSGLIYAALDGSAPLMWPLAGAAAMMMRGDYRQMIQKKEEYQMLRERERITSLELQLKKQSFSVMLSQIRPHFIFNALSSIRALCAFDPPRAEEGVIQFSNYLRGNFEAISENAAPLVPVSREFEHIKSYIALEKMRFEDRLNVSLNLQCENFTVPPLGLQPFVENAVRYGVTQRSEGGSIQISSWEGKDNFCIKIQDDGVGTNPFLTSFDGHPKLGLDAAVERLKTACGAETEIQAVPGEGTTVLIKLPKRGNTNDSDRSG